MTLSKKAYNRILEEIISGALRLGQMITVDRLSDKFGMSNTPVREAIISLTKEEMLTRRGKYYYVVYPDPIEINQMFELRVELESLSAYFAASRITATQKSDLSKIMQEMEELTHGKATPIDLACMNGRFHATVVRATQNRYLEIELDLLRTRLRIVRVTQLGTYESRIRELSQHQGIGEAILSGNSTQAKRTMRKHQLDVWKRVREQVLPGLLY